MKNTIIYNGRHYDLETVKSYYDYEVTNFDDLGAKTEQEYFDKYIELDKNFIKLFYFYFIPVEQ